jgi:hypothetical protein
MTRWRGSSDALAGNLQPHWIIPQDLRFIELKAHKTIAAEKG